MPPSSNFTSASAGLLLLSVCNFLIRESMSFVTDMCVCSCPTKRRTFLLLITSVFVFYPRRHCFAQHSCSLSLSLSMILRQKPVLILLTRLWTAAAGHCTHTTSMWVMVTCARRSFCSQVLILTTFSPSYFTWASELTQTLHAAAAADYNEIKRFLDDFTQAEVLSHTKPK